MRKQEWLTLVLTIIALVGLTIGTQERTIEVHSESMKSPQKVQRIVSLSPSNTEILFAIGAGKNVVGVTNYCDYPAEALLVSKVGDFYRLDPERIISLEPDLVLADASLQEEIIHQLERAGIWIIPIKNEKMEDILEGISKISSLTGHEEEGRVLRESLEEKLHPMQKIEQDQNRKKVFIEVWDRPLLTVGKTSHLNDLVEQAGGVNVAYEDTRSYFEWNIEKLYQADPDIYIRLRGTDMGSRAEKLPDKLRALRAVREGNVVTLFGNSFVRAGPRSFDALEKMAQVINEKGQEK